MAKKKAKKRVKKAVGAVKKALGKATKVHLPKPIQKIEVTIKKKCMGEAPEEHHFVLSDGKRLKSVYDLIDALEDMSEDVFSYHVSELKNDFGNWINDVFEEENLAQEIKAAKGKMKIQLKLMKHMIDEMRK